LSVGQVISGSLPFGRFKWLKLLTPEGLTINLEELVALLEQLKAPKGQRATNSLYPPPLEEGKPRAT